MPQTFRQKYTPLRHAESKRGLDAGFGLVIGFIEDLQIVTTSNCKALTNSLLTTTYANSSQIAMSSPVIVWQRIPTMSPATVLTILPAGDCLTIN
jgi:hypothetical protein